MKAMRARRSRVAAGVLCAASLSAGAWAAGPGCGALVSLNGYAGDATTGDSAGPGDARAEGAPVPACTTPQGIQGLCAPPTPASWEGPLILYEGPISGPPPPSCSSGYTPSCSNCTLFADPSSAPAPCTACSCNTSAVQCAVWLVAGSFCNGESLEGGTPFVDAGCYPTSQYLQQQQVGGTYAAPLGSCTPQRDEGGPPGPEFDTAVTACLSASAPVQGSCVTGATCLPGPPAPFPPRFCVSQAGNTPCPAGSPYTVSYVVYSGADDSRKCADCTCGPPDAGDPEAGGGCMGDIAFCYDDACAPQNCSSFDKCDMGTLPSFLVEGDMTFRGGCDPSGGQAIGAVNPTGPTTYCCTQ